MPRWSWLLLLMALVGAGEPTAQPEAISTESVDVQVEAVAAPEVSFRDLEWWGPDCEGRFGWHAGQDLTPMPAGMGRIEARKITNIQELVWEHAYHRVLNVQWSGRRWFVGFDLGTLKLTHLEHERWQVEFTPTGEERPTGIFRTQRPPGGSWDPP